MIDQKPRDEPSRTGRFSTVLIQLDIFGRYVFTTTLNVVTRLQSILDIDYIEECMVHVFLMNLNIVEIKFHTLSCMSIRSFLFSMSVFFVSDHSYEHELW